MQTKEYILRGPKPTYPLEDGTIGKYFFNSLKKNERLPNCMTDVQLGHSISYKKLLTLTCRLGICLIRNGCGNGTSISICSENSIYYLQPILAAWYVGVAVAPVNHNYTERELIHVLTISKPKIIFCSKQTLAKVVKLKQTLPFIQKIVILDGQGDVGEAETLNNFVKRYSDENFEIEDLAVNHCDRNEHVCVILCSSGTTGLPKGVMLTDKNLMIRFNQTKDPLCKVNHLELGDVALNFLPLFHGFGFSTTLGFLDTGLHILIMQGYNEGLLLNSIVKYQIKSINTVPSVIISLAKSDDVDKYNLRSLTEVVCGAAPLPNHIVRQVKQRLGIRDVRQGYGLTEGTVASTITSLGNKKNSSVGRVMTYTQLKVVDVDTQQSLRPNRIGEICLKGDTLMKGYMGDLMATKNAIDRDGWLHTGDIGYYDEDQDVFIVDRLKELIKYQSFQVAPAELEALILEYPGVKEAAVVGKPDLLAGELPTAFIVTNSDANISKQEIQEYIKKEASREKQLRGGVLFVDSLPKNATGKILRKELRKMLEPMSKL